MKNQTDRDVMALVKLQSARELLVVLESDHTRAPDSLQAWTAYRLARANGLPIPEWVLQDFDKAERNLYDLSMSPPSEQIAAAAGEALGFLPPGLDEQGQILSGLDVFRLRQRSPARYRKLVLDCRLREKSGPFNPFRSYDGSWYMALRVYAHKLMRQPGSATKAVAEQYGGQHKLRSVEYAWAKHRGRFAVLPATTRKNPAR